MLLPGVPSIFSPGRRGLASEHTDSPETGTTVEGVFALCAQFETRQGLRAPVFFLRASFGAFFGSSSGGEHAVRSPTRRLSGGGGFVVVAEKRGAPPPSVVVAVS